MSLNFKDAWKTKQRNICRKRGEVREKKKNSEDQSQRHQNLNSKFQKKKNKENREEKMIKDVIQKYFFQF